MYCSYYCLNQRPFELAPIGGLVYQSKTHREGIAVLRYGIVTEKQFVLLIGGVGAGKTTLLNTLLLMLDDSIQALVINNPTLTRDEFYQYLGKQLGFSTESNKAEFIAAFTQHLEECDTQGRKTVLIIDEAQAFPVEMLEEIRLLSNLANDKNTLTIMLVGQPELQHKLAAEVLLPLRQRIGTAYKLKSFELEDTKQYINYRLHQAGFAGSAIFTERAIREIHRLSRGTPRLINIICDQALLMGFENEARTINHKQIKGTLDYIQLEAEDTLSVSERDVPRKTSLQVKLLLGALFLLSFGALYAFLHTQKIITW